MQQNTEQLNQAPLKINEREIALDEQNHPVLQALSLDSLPPHVSVKTRSKQTVHKAENRVNRSEEEKMIERSRNKIQKGIHRIG